MVQQELRKDIEKGIELGVPDGILFNGQGPYRYNEALVSDGIAYHMITVDPGSNLVYFYLS